MSIPVILFEMAVFAMLFTVIILCTSRGSGKLGAGAIHNYPPDIQEE